MSRDVEIWILIGWALLVSFSRPLGHIQQLVELRKQFEFEDCEIPYLFIPKVKFQKPTAYPIIRNEKYIFRKKRYNPVQLLKNGTLGHRPISTNLNSHRMTLVGQKKSEIPIIQAML